MTANPRRRSPGTIKLSEIARHLVLPRGIVQTEWPAVNKKCHELGINFDRWQDGAGRAILATNADGMYAADTAVLSIPRQVGKTFLLGAIVFALCLLNPGLTVIWTAHHSRTAKETFDSMQGMARMARIAPHIRAIRVAAGEEGILFANGSRVLFGARERGFGRGFSGVDVLVFDEAQILSESAMDNMVPTTNQASMGNPLILLAGTPPRPQDPGEVFTNLRKEALESGSGNSDTLYIELSADPESELTNRAQWSKANPSYPHRTPAKAIIRMLKHLGVASFRREALGIWDAVSRTAPIVSLDDWSALASDLPTVKGATAYGVKFSADGARLAVGLAMEHGDSTFLETDASPTSSGMAPLARWLAERANACDLIVIDGKSNAGALVEALIDAGVSHRKIKRPSLDEVITAHANVIEAIRTKSITHASQPGLNVAVAGTIRRDIGNQGGWGFKGQTPDIDVTPFESVTLALLGLGGARDRTGKKRSSNSPTFT